jgi:hypothetical protein
MVNEKMKVGKEVFELWNTADEIKSGDMQKIAKRNNVTEREVRTIFRAISRRSRKDSKEELSDKEISKAILEAKIIMEVQDFYTNTEVKNITKAAALKIRTAIATELGNKRYFSQSGSHAILNPFSSPKYSWWGDSHWDGTGEEPLVFHTGFYKEQRRIQTFEQIREIEYVIYPSGKYTFDEQAIDIYKDPFKVEKMMKEETDIRIFQEITQLEMG